MRLNRHELDAIQHILTSNPAAGTAWLFGSRADDAGRGGDIDLYWEPGQKVSLRQALAMEYRLCADCDCKVDLLIRNPGEPEQPIHSIAKRGVRL
jgi:predicted nucleotidyltransferase